MKAEEKEYIPLKQYVFDKIAVQIKKYISSHALRFHKFNSEAFLYRTLGDEIAASFVHYFLGKTKHVETVIIEVPKNRWFMFLEAILPVGLRIKIVQYRKREIQVNRTLLCPHANIPFDDNPSVHLSWLQNLNADCYDIFKEAQ